MNNRMIEREHSPRIEYLRVRNYRALQDVEFTKITPFMALPGPNGSGKSTVFDVFNFLAECFQFGLRHAWDRRGRAKELKTRGQDGPVVVEIKYRERRDLPLITYHLAIDEGPKGPYVAEEWLQWTRKTGKSGRPFRFLRISTGAGPRNQRRDAGCRRPASRYPPAVAGSGRGEHARPVRRASTGGGSARVHHGLVCVLPLD